MKEPVFPAEFLASLSGEPGFDEPGFKNAHIKDTPVTTIRLNPFKPSPIKTGRAVPWYSGGFYLDNRPSFTFDPLFHAGCYYVQEASSMFIGHILQHIRPGNNQSPLNILDLCAAPGGKSTLINSLMGPDDLLVSNEIIKTRIPVLCDNLNRWGTANTIASNNDPKDFSRLHGFFDIILADAPCSGSGMFRKDPQAISEWSEANVDLCHQRQERILADVHPALKEDGYLIYSTCSYAHQENEDITDWLCREFSMESVRIPVNGEWGIVETQSDDEKAWGYRFYPGRVKGEGLFAACLKKKAAAGQYPSAKLKGYQKSSPQDVELIKSYLNGPDAFHYFKINDDWLAIGKKHRESLDILQRHLYIKKSGVRIGRLMGRDLIPDHELALSNAVNKNAVLQTELNHSQAIQFLRRDNLDLNTANKGWSLMKFAGHALGWAKLLPNRVNNYYPKGLRILSQEPAPAGT